MAIRTKSVNSPIDREIDGLRILAARSTGMFVPKSRYDVWMPNLGPSESLLNRLRRREVSWERYLELYEHELTREGGGQPANRRHRNHGQLYTLKLIKKISRGGSNVTLLCHCDESEDCHRHTLRRLIVAQKL